ncbi:hypothetical protein [Rhizobium populisoli]|uniref:hypothetical protein n=1 Tax=Rhizobium populisoli TaxID=2859785 RepID=UPI0035E3F83B
MGACNAALLCRDDVERSRDCFVAAYAEYLVKLHPNRRVEPSSPIAPVIKKGSYRRPSP